MVFHEIAKVQKIGQGGGIGIGNAIDGLQHPLARRKPPVKGIQKIRGRNSVGINDDKGVKIILEKPLKGEPQRITLAPFFRVIALKDLCASLFCLQGRGIRAVVRDHDDAKTGHGIGKTPESEQSATYVPFFVVRRHDHGKNVTPAAQGQPRVAVRKAGDNSQRENVESCQGGD